ncbi:hypothetical protein ABFT23_04105 [Nocardioides sp. C4-1]|uniref:hypothetical protein n=1 Tax=Nocardioides sp. C4-1 TaxID=3151851 RepID=UPI0032666357
MAAMSTAVGANLVAHGLHYAMVLAGLWGLAALLLPHTLDRVVRTSRLPDDEHARRVSALRDAVASGSPGIPVVAPAIPPCPTDPSVRTTPGVPLALVATAAAAGIHAAVAPAHLAESPVTGAFFLAVAAGQLAWALAAAGHPTRVLLHAGIALQLALVALWAVTRTVGLPFGLLPEPHPVGGWDLACVAWQLVAVAGCAQACAVGVPERCPGWFSWHPLARAAVGAAASSLVLLTITGAHS